jgi:acetylglutamate kinase
VTTREDIEAVRMVLSGAVNKELVSSLVAQNVPAVGVSGEDGGLIRAALSDNRELGRVGNPTNVNVQLLETLMDGGFLPVISPLAAEEGAATGDALNVNGDDAAAAIAIALGADELLFIADVEGVLNDGGAAIASLDQMMTSELIDRGTIKKGMRAKIEAGFGAIAGGVSRVRIAALEAIDHADAGTTLKLAQSLTT